MTLRDIQIQHLEWQRKNFGRLPPVDSILGVVEEVGELAHSYTKNKQGIRVDQDHIKKMRDAVGDITIFLISLCSAMDWDYQNVVNETWKEVSSRDWVSFPEKGVPK